jgi:hypothetical protein
MARWSWLVVVIVRLLIMTGMGMLMGSLRAGGMLVVVDTAVAGVVMLVFVLKGMGVAVAMLVRMAVFFAIVAVAMFVEMGVLVGVGVLMRMASPGHR